MFELDLMYKRYLRYLLSFLAIYTLLLFVSSSKEVWLSLIFGTLLGMFNLWLLVRKTTQFVDKVSSGKTARTLGTFSRFASAIFAVVIVVSYPEYFEIIPVVLGLMTIYIVIFIDFFVKVLKEKKAKRGVK